jgi:type IV secretion system protein VirB10
LSADEADERAAPAPSARPQAGAVRGERGAALVGAVRSLQSRASSVLAAALMIALGVSALTWYYAHALTRQARTRAGAQATAANRAQGEMALPALGPISPPTSREPLERATAGAPAPLLPPDLPLTQASVPGAIAGANPAVPAAKTPAQLAFDRRLSGVVFTREAQGSPEPAAAAGSAPAAPPPLPPAIAADGGTERSGTALAGLLVPTQTAAAQAQRLPDARFLLPRGAFIDCTLETAIDSTLPGMTTCVTASDTFGADGKVVLLERGTKLVGETRGQVQQGQARLFVLWTQARTPAGVVVPLDSPGTDELGRAGVTGEVQRHFWQRFGAAMLISLVDGAVQAGVQAAASGSNGAVIYAPSGSQDVLTEVLKGTVQIAPTIVKRNGDRVQVLVARDIDFRPVYELRVAPGR